MSDAPTPERALTLTYKRDPSLENYVALRRQYPDIHIEVSLDGGFAGSEKLMDNEEELARFGFDALKTVSICDADLAAISEVSLKLIGHIVERRRLEAEGETQLISRGLAMSDDLIDWLICCMLDSTSWCDTLEIHPDLIVLIRERLRGSKVRERSEVIRKRQSISWVAAQLLARGEEPTLRRLGTIASVEPSTIMRWFPDGSLLEEAERLKDLFDENGRFREPLLTKPPTTNIAETTELE